jgi:2'-5' RNA ligase
MTVVVGALLDEPHAQRVRDQREAVADEFGTDPVSTPTVHFTLQSFRSADRDGVASALASVADDTAPLAVRTNSLGVFPRDAVYVTVVRDGDLSAFHERVQSALEPHGEPYRNYADGVNPYGPETWVPHVSLATGVENVASVVRFCRSREETFLWDASVSELVAFELGDDGFAEIDRVELTEE